MRTVPSIAAVAPLAEGEIRLEDDSYQARRQIGNYLIVFFANADEDSFWQIGFGAYKPDSDGGFDVDGDEFQLTNDGHAKQVIDFVQLALQDFNRRFRPQQIKYFVDDQRRIKVYDRLLARIWPSYDTEIRQGRKTTTVVVTRD